MSADLRSQIERAFQKIGTSGATDAPDKQSNIGPLLHEGYVSSMLASMAKKRYEEWKKGVKDTFDAEIESLASGDKALLASTENGASYALTASRAAATTRLDKSLLRKKLIDKFDMTTTDADQLIAECSKESTGALSLEVARS